MLEELKQMTFANEAEEAAWWEAHEDALADEFERAGAGGTLGRSTVLKRAALATATLCLDAKDAAKAHAQAAKRGLSLQAYLETIVHEALLKADVSSLPVAS